MTRKENLRFVLLFAFGFMAGGGWLLHLGLHPPTEAVRNYIPFVAGLIAMAFIPLGFVYRRTVEYDYVVNGMLVIIGTITMATYTLQRWPTNLTLLTFLRDTLFAEIIITWTLFMLGKALFELEEMLDLHDPPRRGPIWRYPNAGWWGIHFLGLSVAFMLGYWLWP